jgi:hypothetical protein
LKIEEWSDGQQPVAHPKKKKKKRHFSLSVYRFKRRYIFTDNVHPPRGIMSFILGIISMITMIICIKGAFDAGGAAGEKLGAAAFLAFVYSITGLVLGILARRQRNIFRFFPNLGIFICTLNILAMTTMVILGFLV